MNSSILYVASVVAVALAILQTYYLTLEIVYRSSFWSLPPVLLLSACSFLFIRRYRSGCAGDGSESFDKAVVLSTLGVVGAVIGLVWLASEIRMVIELVRLPDGMSVLVWEKTMPPLILTGFGVYYGFGKSRKSSQGN